jgi:hypothetical protein
MALSKEKAEKYYTGQKKMDDSFRLPSVEEFFFEENGFLYETSGVYECDSQFRRFILNSQKTKYYCSPKIGSIGAFRIRDLSKITSAELVVQEAGSGAATGALLFGVAGAVAGSSIKKSVIKIVLHTTDIEEPIVNLEILTVPTANNNNTFKKCYDAANKIYGQIKAVADQNSPAAPQSTASLSVADELNKLKNLLDQGILTQEEFDAQKKRLLANQ